MSLTFGGAHTDCDTVHDFFAVSISHGHGLGLSITFALTFAFTFALTLNLDFTERANLIGDSGCNGGFYL